MRIINDFNLKKQAEELGVSVWRTPSFLFIVMGVSIIIIMTAVYHLSKFYSSPEMVVWAEAFVTIILFTLGNLIIQEVEQMAKLNKMKTEFISVASHQLRTPIAAVRWQVELLLSKFGEGLTEKQKEKLENIDVMSSKMKRLVNDLLDVARIDQGKLILKKEKFDLAEIVKNEVKEVESLAKSKQIKIYFSSRKKIPAMSGDPDKIKIAVENLISNAIKYTLEKGRIKIGVSADENNLNFSIEDTGVGIPEKQQKMVFKKFFRSSNIARYQTEGTGLGLYIAKSIIEQSGGKIWFVSQENVGTTFSFSLPLKGSAE